MSLNPIDWCWGKPGTWAIKYGHEAAGARLVPGSTGASLVLSLLTPKSMGVGLVPGIIGEGLKPESTGMSLTLGLYRPAQCWGLMGRVWILGLLFPRDMGD